MTSLGESGRVSLDIDGILGERFQVMQHNTHVRIITNVHRHVNCLPTTPNNKRKLLPACTHTYIQLVQALESRWKRSSVPSIRSPLVDEERMRPGHWLRPVLCVSFSALSLQEWQRVHKICASYHRRQSLWGTEARRLVLPQNLGPGGTLWSVPPQNFCLWSVPPQNFCSQMLLDPCYGQIVVLNAFWWIKHTKSISAGASPRIPLG